MAPPYMVPAFVRYPDEAAIIARLLAGYGELEFHICQCMEQALGDLNIATRLLFRTRSEVTRIGIADAILRPFYAGHSLAEAWDIIRDAISWCKDTRNQYAHCHWFDDEGHGLFFTHLEKGAKSLTGEMTIKFLHVDAPLLTEQEEYFLHAQFGLEFLRCEQMRLAGKIRHHAWPALEEKSPPPRHNPPEKHRMLSRATIDEPIPEGPTPGNQR